MIGPAAHLRCRKVPLNLYFHGATGTRPSTVLIPPTIHRGLTASTCSRVLWVPWWMPGGMAQEQFDEQVLSTLKQYAAEKAIMAGGASLAFE